MKLVQQSGYGAETPSRKERKTGDGRAKWVSSPYTLVVDNAPEYDAMVYEVGKLLRGEHAEIAIRVGWSKVHPNDDFCRKTGLALAEQRLKPLVATLTYFSARKGELRVSLETADGELMLLYKQGKRPVINGNTITGNNY